MMRITSSTFTYLLTGILFVIAMSLALFSESTFGNGDSVGHYLMAKYAWKHPYLFFDHWGKPVFTMLSSPFAQLGFNGIKVFNVLVTFMAAWLTYRYVQSIHIKYAVWVIPIYFCAPDGIGVMLSGLTEPLFALLLIVALLWVHHQRFIPATIIFSFLPMSRTEGIIVLGVYTVYLFLNKKYVLLPLVLSGQMVIAFLGYWVYHDVLWVFNKIPYITNESHYWSGPLMHYIVAMPHVFGLFASVLLYTGCLVYVYSFFKNWIAQRTWLPAADFRFIIYWGFIAFIVTHSVFYYLGIMNDVGLTRVSVAMFPAMVFISIEALIFIHQFLCKYFNAYKVVIAGSITLVAGMVFFCYAGSMYRIRYQSLLQLDAGQKLIKHEVLPYVQQKYPQHRLYFSDMSVALFGEIDIYENSPYDHLILKKRPDFKLDKDELIIWDHWFSVVEERIDKSILLGSKNIKLEKEFNSLNARGEPIEAALFSSRD
jgi:hypothetical protein